MAETLSQLRQTKSITVLANANELVTRVIQEVVGNDVSDSINGSALTNDVVCSIVQHRYKASLEQSQFTK